MNEKPNLDGLQGIFKDYEKQIKKKARRTIAIIVIVCLFFGLLGFFCGRASATSWTYSSDHKVFGSEMFDVYMWDILYPYIESHVNLEDYSSCLVCYDPSSPNNGVGYICVALFSDEIIDCGGTGQVYTEYPDSSGVYFAITNYSYSPYKYSYSAGTRVSDNKYVYGPLAGGNWTSPAFSYGYTWCSSYLRGYQPNLTFRDTRTLTASKVYLTDNYYLQVEAYPTFASEFSYVTLTYFDTLGTFTKTLSRSDGIRVSEVGEDAVNSYVTLTINPNLVSQYKFTVTGIEYVSSGGFGNKSLSQLDLIFNEDPFPLPNGWDSINSYSTYNTYSSIGVVGGGIATFEIGYLNNNQSLLSWRESTGKVHQPFRLSWIVLPDFLWDYGAFQFADFNLEEMYQLFESYDVVILGVGSSIFNDLYPDHVDPAGVKDNYDYVKSAWQLGLGVDYCISVIDGFESPYRSCNLSDSDDTFTVTRSSQCGFIWSRNFLLKQVSWYCGDTSERLLELESRLVDENDGALTSIQEKLNYIYEDNNGFINDCLHSLSDISYAINNLDFGALGDISLKLDRIIGYLDFDIDIDINKLVSPWKEIFQIGKGFFDNSQFMWRNMIDSYDVISDGLEVDPNYSDNVLLPSITGPVPLFPTIAPNPLLPILTPVPTLVPISVGGG